MKVVCGFTPTPPGQAALLAALAEVTHHAGSLVVLNSSRGDAISDPGFAQDADLEWVRSTCADAGVEVDLRQVVRGRDASDELVELAGEVAADLVVIGLRRRSAVGKMLMGSNAHRILMDAPCPVLAVKPATDHG